MKKCRLKIITAIINQDENKSDEEVIKYVSQNEDFMTQYTNFNKKEIDEEEKNINFNLVEEDSTIIKEKNDLLKSKVKLRKENVFLIDGLFSSTHNNTNKNLFKNNQIRVLDISQPEPTKEKDNKIKLFSGKKKIIKKSVEKPTYEYKWEHKFDNIINTFYNSQNPKTSNITSTNKLNSENNLLQKEETKNIENENEIITKKNESFDNKKEEKKKIEENTDNRIKSNEPIIENIFNGNDKLNTNINVEINREDELKGELFILRNQYNILLNQLKEEENKIKKYQEDMNNKNKNKKTIENEKDEIINYYINLNECLSKGEILIVTKPNLYNYINSINNDNNKESKNGNENLEINNKIIDNIDDYLNYDIVTLLLKGYFINMNLNNAEEITNKIWNNKKPIQTLESLKEDLLILINKYISESDSSFINSDNRNIIINYLYSFCNEYQYMTKNEFKSLFSDKLGYFIEYNENILINKLYKNCHGKLREFVEILNNLDINKTGKIGIYEFIKALKENNIIIFNKEILNEQKDIIDLLQLLVINMKKNINYMEKNLDEENKDNNTERINNINNESRRKIDIYELYYESLIKIILENKNSESPLYKGIIKSYLIDKNINSMKDFMEPLLLNNDIIINKNSNKYLKSENFNNFLISNQVLGENETFLIPYNEESLIEINQLIQEVDKANPLV